MLHKDDVIRLRHMLEAAMDAVSFSQNKTRASLDTDKMLRFSLIRCVKLLMRLHQSCPMTADMILPIFRGARL